MTITTHLACSLLGRITRMRNALSPHGGYAKFIAVSVVVVAAGAAQAAGDNDSDLWAEVQKGGTRDDYQVYLEQFPKGKFVVLAKSRIKKMDDMLAERAALQEQTEWNGLVKNPTGSGLKDYLARYPNGRYRQEAQELSLRTPSIPPRPQLPIAVSEDVWRTLEASPAYLNWPQPKKIKVNALGVKQVEYTGSKSAALPTPKPTNDVTSRELRSIGGKCGNWTMGLSADFRMDVTLCGPVSVVSLMNGDATKGTILKSVDIQGSLFPMRVGAEQTLREVNSNMADAKYDSILTRKCRVLGNGLASNIHPRLTGTAWTLACEQVMEMPGIPGGSSAGNFSYEDYFLEDLGTLLSMFGVQDMKVKKFVIPTIGSQTTIIAAGDYGSRSTTTYQSYDWTVED